MAEGLYKYDIPTWFLEIWSWLLDVYSRARPPSPQIYWHNLKTNDQELLKQAFRQATEDDPDNFPKCKRIQELYRQIILNKSDSYGQYGSSGKKNGEEKPQVNRAQILVNQKFLNLLRKKMKRLITEEEFNTQMAELRVEYDRAGTDTDPATSEQWDDRVPF